MLRKTITYTDPLSEEEVVEEVFFHLSKADVVEMQLEEHRARYTDKEGKLHEGLQAHLTRISESNDGKVVLQEFRSVLRRAYGQKVEGRFVKNAKLWEQFEGSEAFSELIFSLYTDPAEMAKFVQGILPPNLEAEAAKIAARVRAQQAEGSGNGATPAQAIDIPEDPAAAAAAVTQNENVPDPAQGTRVLSREELMNMDNDELQAGLASGRYKLS